VTIQADGEGLHYLLGAGEPLLEPVIAQGPFVMNTSDEVLRAIIAYQTGRMGRL
jgi:redox-sensitive bicupin YhaK (pirin superfamily)